MCVQYIGGCSVHRGVFSTSGDIMSTLRMFSTSGGYHDECGGYHEFIGGYSVHWRDTMSKLGGYYEYIGEMFSTSEGYHDTCGGAT